MNSSIRHVLLVCALVAVLSTALSACGRKGAPEPPPDSDFPRQYPTY